MVFRRSRTKGEVTSNHTGRVCFGRAATRLLAHDGTDFPHGIKLTANWTDQRVGGAGDGTGRDGVGDGWGTVTRASQDGHSNTSPARSSPTVSRVLQLGHNTTMG